jgi:hypothetical protein
MAKPDSIKIDEVEYVRKDSVKHIQPVAKTPTLFDMVGQCYLIRTVTYHYIGRIVGFIAGTRIAALEGASWLADSGRFMQCVKEGKLNEVEPIGECFVNLDTATDIIPWIHALPGEQK